MSVPFFLRQRVCVIENTCWRGVTEQRALSRTPELIKCKVKLVVSIHFLHHQSGYLAGWEPLPPTDPSEVQSAARRAQLHWSTADTKACKCACSTPATACLVKQSRENQGFTTLPTLCGWDLAQLSSLAKTPSLHSMIQCSSMGSDSSLVAAMAMPKPISRTRPPTRDEKTTFNLMAKLLCNIHSKEKTIHGQNTLPHNLYWQSLHYTLIF